MVINNKEVNVLGFTSITQVIHLDEDLGHYFFSPGTMRWWNSRVYDDVERIGNLGVGFITSERDSYHNRQPRRLYTVRMMNTEGKLSEVSSFQQFTTLAKARLFLLAYAKYHRSLP